MKLPKLDPKGVIIGEILTTEIGVNLIKKIATRDNSNQSFQ